MQIQVPTVKIELSMVKLTAKLFKQLRKVEYNEIRKYMEEKTLDGMVIGWIHGLAVGEEWRMYLLLRISEGKYATFEAAESTCKKYEQIFLA